MVYYLYVHTVPNGKIYVGVTTNPIRRWNYGCGYSENKQFFQDIKKYGWNNIKHEIITTFLDLKTATCYERLYISLLDAENPEVGYNNSSYKEILIKDYLNKTEYIPEKFKMLEFSHNIQNEVFLYGEILSFKEYKKCRNTISKYVIKYKNATYKVTKKNYDIIEFYRLKNKEKF